MFKTCLIELKTKYIIYSVQLLCQYSVHYTYKKKRNQLFIMYLSIIIKLVFFLNVINLFLKQ